MNVANDRDRLLVLPAIVSLRPTSAVPGDERCTGGLRRNLVGERPHGTRTSDWKIAARSQYHLQVPSAPGLVDPHLPSLSPWLRVDLVIRQIRSTAWDSATWPTIKETLRDALRLRSRMRRWAWWN